MPRPARAPGLAFEAVRPPPELSPLRSDVAAFVGQTRRGPVGVPVRVEGWRGYQREFGGLDRELDMTYAVRGYFANGGEVAWVVRVAASGTVATATWDTVGFADLPADRVRVDAASPGAWSDGARVTLTYRGRTASGTPTVDVQIRAVEDIEEFRGIPVEGLLARFQPVDWQPPLSRLIRLAVDAPHTAALARAFASTTITLRGGTATPPKPENFLAAIDALDDVPEVALVAFPDVHALGEAAPSILQTAAEHAEMLRDRLVLVDLPRTSPTLRWHVDAITTWVKKTLGRCDNDLAGMVRWWRAAALFHPWVRVDDPRGGAARPTRDIPPSGHVAGVISQLDRERGAHATPANAPMLDVIDLREEYDDDEHALLNVQGVDLLRCVPSLGFSVWGGRTLDRTSRFIAHRRLVHRLVRAIRRVAEPLVFETNGPALWFAFVRAITAVLLEAWRAGSLAGSRPEEAFDVTCDESTNPPEEIELGRCVCTIAVAPAIPMEFILIRVALSRDGALEVLS